MKSIKTLLTTQTPVTLLKLSHVMACTALPKSTIYRKIAQNEFPRPVRLGKKSVAWRSDEIQQWIDSRPLSNSNHSHSVKEEVQI